MLLSKPKPFFFHFMLKDSQAHDFGFEMWNVSQDVYEAIPEVSDWQFLYELPYLIDHIDHLATDIPWWIVLL